VVASICREDLKEADITDAVIDNLTDEDMRHIAAMMGDLYNDNGFWEDLTLCVNRPTRCATSWGKPMKEPRRAA
jgi:hypothetical protein